MWRSPHFVNLQFCSLQIETLLWKHTENSKQFQEITCGKTPFQKSSGVQSKYSMKLWKTHATPKRLANSVLKRSCSENFAIFPSKTTTKFCYFSYSVLYSPSLYHNLSIYHNHFLSMQTSSYSLLSLLH